MNQKDYKAIAEIISRTIPKNPVLTIFVHEIADYFEKEDKENQPTKNVWNRKQFLKACGVEK